jgi:Na+/proline symporter
MGYSYSNLWRTGTQPDYFNRNPLGFMALIIALATCRSAYEVILQGHFSWTALLSSVLCITFLIAYWRKKRIAWTICGLIIGILVPLNAALFYAGFPRKLPPPTALSVIIGVWIVLGACLYYVRAPYYQYVDRGANNELTGQQKPNT